LTDRRDQDVEAMIKEADIAVIPFTSEHCVLARAAYRAYGKGSGSRARLNFGDCFSYALAKSLNRPLLFKGDDFTHTDVKSAYQPG